MTYLRLVLAVVSDFAFVLFLASDPDLLADLELCAAVLRFVVAWRVGAVLVAALRVLTSLRAGSVLTAVLRFVVAWRVGAVLVVVLRVVVSLRVDSVLTAVPRVSVLVRSVEVTSLLLVLLLRLDTARDSVLAAGRLDS